MRETLERVKMGGDVLFGIIPPSDTTIEAALAKASEMIEHGEYYDAAFVDAEKGLVIFDPGKAYREEFADEVTGFRLQMPRLDDGGVGSLTADVILSLFGFGEPETIYTQVVTSRNIPLIHLIKGMDATPPQ